MTADTEGEMATDATVLSDGSVAELRQALSGTLSRRPIRTTRARGGCGTG